MALVQVVAYSMATDVRVAGNPSCVIGVAESAIQLD
jgi:hypothetical protein